jgi:hypothetical protein
MDFYAKEISELNVIKELEQQIKDSLNALKDLDSKFEEATKKINREKSDLITAINKEFYQKKIDELEVVIKNISETRKTNVEKYIALQVTYQNALIAQKDEGKDFVWYCDEDYGLHKIERIETSKTYTIIREEGRLDVIQSNRLFSTELTAAESEKSNVFHAKGNVDFFVTDYKSNCFGELLLMRLKYLEKINNFISKYNLQKPE